MVTNRIYYAFKPLLPDALRLTLRRWFTLRTRARTRNVWPVLPGSERAPQGWPGWPDGKQFAFVLTHDVEGPYGLANCTELMKLEMRLGFRSSFYLIPEGPYVVTADLRRELFRNGFEVGVHDLHHDGRLYRNRRSFFKKAQRINRYLEEWGAVGFRSGFMLHKLDWLHDLNILYDASTFDTDPFEPQPDGVGTIFPFWVSGEKASGAPLQVAETEGSSSGAGYVELPYTLCQDSTLFLLLGEPNEEIWIRKLDWIVQHGGMALLNTHPDYFSTESVKPNSWRFPAHLYERFLETVRSRYGGAYWHATAGELASWYKSSGARQKVSGRQVNDTPFVKNGASKHIAARICMVTYSTYDNDNRVRRYARELAKRGDVVEVFSLKRKPDQCEVEDVEGVRVYRLLFRSRTEQKSKTDFLLPVMRFLLDVSARIAWRHLRNPYDVFHVHNVPDFLVLAALLPRFSGAKVILDIHDILPEFYASKFGLRPDAFGVRVLKRVEKSSAWVAHHVILSNHIWRDKYAVRTGKGDKCSCFINNVDAELFQRRPRTRDDGKLVIIYPGGLQSHQGLDIAIRAFEKVSRKLPNAELHIYGDGSAKDDLIALTHMLGLETKVLFFEPLPLSDIIRVVANADLGVVPKRADSFGNEAYSTKIMEFMSLGIPVVVSDTKIDKFYFNDSVVRFFPSGDPDALAEAMLDLLRNPQLRERMVANALEYVLHNNWESRRDEYLRLVDSLAEASVSN